MTFCNNRSRNSNDDRLFKFNHRLRKNYLIQNALLEKRLLCNSSYYTQLPTVHVITDLKACYNH